MSLLDRDKTGVHRRADATTSTMRGVASGFSRHSPRFGVVCRALFVRRGVTRRCQQAGSRWTAWANCVHARGTPATQVTQCCPGHHPAGWCLLQEARQWGKTIGEQVELMRIFQPHRGGQRAVHALTPPRDAARRKEPTAAALSRPRRPPAAPVGFPHSRGGGGGGGRRGRVVDAGRCRRGGDARARRRQR